MVYCLFNRFKVSVIKSEKLLDQEIKQILSSLFFVRKRIDIQITHIIKSLNSRQNQSIGSPKLQRSSSSNNNLSMISNSFVRIISICLVLSLIEFE